MRSALRATWTLLVCVTAHATEQTGAPLSDSKRQLQQLQQEQKSRTIDTPTLSGTISSLGKTTSAPLEQALLIPVTPAPETQPGKDSAKQTDYWLLAGFNRLEATKPSRLTAARQGRTSGAERSRDVADGTQPLAPTLLGIYAQQAAKRRHPNDGLEATTEATPAMDPLASYLQAWLGNSPVRSLRRDSMSRRNSAGAGQPESGPDGAERPQMESSLFFAHPNDNPATQVTAMPQENPFLQAITTDTSIATAHAAVPDPAKLMLEDTPHQNTAESAQAAAAVPPATTYQAPRSQQPDDKKYFPQLKRF